MTRRTRKIIFFSVIGALIIGLTVSIILIVNEVQRNPLLGTWGSTSGRGSYTFHEDGSVRIYSPGDKLPVLETSYKGTLYGTYAYDKSEKELSITLKIYSKEITSHYTYEIEENTLTLTDTSSKKAKNYSLVIVDK